MRLTRTNVGDSSPWWRAQQTPTQALLAAADPWCTNREEEKVGGGEERGRGKREEGNQMITYAGTLARPNEAASLLARSLAS